MVCTKLLFRINPKFKNRKLSFKKWTWRGEGKSKKKKNIEHWCGNKSSRGSNHACVKGVQSSPYGVLSADHASLMTPLLKSDIISFLLFTRPFNPHSITIGPLSHVLHFPVWLSRAIVLLFFSFFFFISLFFAGYTCYTLR